MKPQIINVITICCLLLLVFVSLCIYSPSYRSVYNITNLIAQCIPLAVVSLGQTLVIISGGIDLSLGSVVSLSTVIAAKLMDTDSPVQIALAICAMMGVAMCIGLLNSLGSNLLKVPPLITTLCMSSVLNGIAFWILPTTGGRINRGFASFVSQKWDILSMPLIILIAVYAIVFYFLYRTRSGVHLYAIGRNRRIAESMGVRIRRASTKAYVAAAMLAALTGLLLACRMRIGDPIIGSAYSMDSITAAAIGGTSLSGGVGLISGTISGAFLVGMLSNAMNIIGVNQFYQYVLKGSLLIIAMVIYSISDFLEVKRRNA